MFNSFVEGFERRDRGSGRMMATSSIKNIFGDLRTISDNNAAQRPVNNLGYPKLNVAIGGGSS